MLSVQVIQSLIMGGVVGIAIGSIPTVAYFKTKGINTEKILSEVKEVITATEPAIAVAKEMAPSNTIVNTVEVIEKWAKIGVQKAEQLYHANQLITNDQKKQAALDTVNTTLKELNIEPTENQQNLINDVIEASVNGLGHKEPTEAQKEVEKQSLTAQVQQLQSTNSQLQQKLAQIQSVAQ